jgi:hypothetical protein
LGKNSQSQKQNKKTMGVRSGNRHPPPEDGRAPQTTKQVAIHGGVAGIVANVFSVIRLSDGTYDLSRGIPLQDPEHTFYRLTRQKFPRPLVRRCGI